MHDARIRTADKIKAPMTAHLAGSGSLARHIHLSLVERPAIPEGACDVAVAFMELKALNAALIVQNCALQAALIRQDQTAVALTGYPRGTGTRLPASACDVALRLVTSGSPGQTDRHATPRGETGPAGLPPRQTQILHLVLAGHPSKNIAADLNISQRTVENHRAAIMRRTGATSLPALARMAIGAAASTDCRAPVGAGRSMARIGNHIGAAGLILAAASPVSRGATAF